MSVLAARLLRPPSEPSHMASSDARTYQFQAQRNVVPWDDVLILSSKSIFRSLFDPGSGPGLRLRMAYTHSVLERRHA
jgi:hypothetical protein